MRDVTLILRIGNIFRVKRVKLVQPPQILRPLSPSSRTIPTDHPIIPLQKPRPWHLRPRVRKRRRGDRDLHVNPTRLQRQCGAVQNYIAAEPRRIYFLETGAAH